MAVQDTHIPEEDNDATAEDTLATAMSAIKALELQLYNLQQGTTGSDGTGRTSSDGTGRTTAGTDGRPEQGRSAIRSDQPSTGGQKGRTAGP